MLKEFKKGKADVEVEREENKERTMLEELNRRKKGSQHRVNPIEEVNWHSPI